MPIKVIYKHQFFFVVIMVARAVFQYWQRTRASWSHLSKVSRAWPPVGLHMLPNVYNISNLKKGQMLTHLNVCYRRKTSHYNEFCFDKCQNTVAFRPCPEQWQHTTVEAASIWTWDMAGLPNKKGFFSRKKTLHACLF